MALDPKSITSVEEVLQKMEYYCAYQERCHVEVKNKLYTFGISVHEIDIVIVKLIETNFLNEERFSSVFCISKFHQKKWGKIRITNELKARKISNFLITKAIKEIPSGEYYETFHSLSEKLWETITEKNVLKKRKKFCDYLLRKGWESNWVYERIKEFEKK